MSTPGEPRPHTGTHPESLATSLEHTLPHPTEQVTVWCTQLDELVDGFPAGGEVRLAAQAMQAQLRGWATGLRQLTLDSLEDAVEHAKERLPEQETSFTCLDTPGQLAEGLELPLEDTPTADMLRDGRHAKSEQEIQESYQGHRQAVAQMYRSSVHAHIDSIVGGLQDPTNNAEVCDLVQRRIMANDCPQPVNRGHVAAALTATLNYKHIGRLQAKHEDPQAYLADYLQSHFWEIFTYERGQTYSVNARDMVVDAWLERNTLPTIQAIHGVVRILYHRHMVEGLENRLHAQREQWAEEARAYAAQEMPTTIAQDDTADESPQEVAKLQVQESLRQLEREDEDKINPLEQDHVRIHDETNGRTYVMPFEDCGNRQDAIAAARTLEALGKRSGREGISHRKLAKEVWESMTIPERLLFFVDDVHDKDSSWLLEDSGRYVQSGVLDCLRALASPLGAVREPTDFDFMQTAKLRVRYGSEPVMPEVLKAQGLQVVFPPDTPKEVIADYRSGAASKESLKTAQTLLDLSRATERPADVNQEDALEYLDFITSSEGRRAIRTVLAAASLGKPKLEDRLAIIRRRVIKPSLREGYYAAWCGRTISGSHIASRYGRARQTGGELKPQTTRWFIGRRDSEAAIRN